MDSDIFYAVFMIILLIQNTLVKISAVEFKLLMCKKSLNNL